MGIDRNSNGEVMRWLHVLQVLEEITNQLSRI